MTTEKTFTVVGTAINPNSELKMRWANDITQRISILIKGKCEDINLHELPEPMTKLEAAEWLIANKELTPDQEFVVTMNIEDRTKVANRKKVKETITENIKTNVKENKKTDPRVADFIEKAIKEKETES